jgi:hypothetical protein
MKIISKSFVAALIMAASLSSYAITVDSTYLIGHVVPGSPSGDQVEIDRLDYFIGQHNGLNPAAPDGNAYTLDFGSSVFPPLPPLPENDGTGTGQIGATGTSLAIDVTGWTYLMVKWANDSYYYYVAGLGEVDVVNDVVFNDNGKAQNASHYRLFVGNDRNVPDGGLTLGLLGLGLTFVEGLRRRINR